MRLTTRRLITVKPTSNCAKKRSDRLEFGAILTWVAKTVASCAILTILA